MGNLPGAPRSLSGLGVSCAALRVPFGAGPLAESRESAPPALRFMATGWTLGHSGSAIASCFPEHLGEAWFLQGQAIGLTGSQSQGWYSLSWRAPWD